MTRDEMRAVYAVQADRLMKLAKSLSPFTERFRFVGDELVTVADALAAVAQSIPEPPQVVLELKGADLAGTALDPRIFLAGCALIGRLADPALHSTTTSTATDAVDFADAALRRLAEKMAPDAEPPPA